MKLKYLVALAAASLINHAASAAPIVLDLTGTVGNGTTATVDFGGFRFDFFSIELDGLSPLTLQVGDDVQANVVLDQSLTVPSAVAGNFVRFFLLGSSATASSTSGSFEFFNMGASVLTCAGGGSTSTAVVNSCFDPLGASFTFDRVQTSFVVDDLSDPTIDVDRAMLDYVLRSPLTGVPEPTSAMLFIAALVGIARRRRTTA